MLGLLAALLLAGASAAEPGRAADNFGLLDAEGHWHELYLQRGAKAVVLVAFGDGCPLSAKLAPELKRLKSLYEPRGVRFFLLDSSPHDNRENLRRFSRDYDLDIPILLDDAGLVADSLGLTRTTETALILREGWRVVYQGAVDDRLDYQAAKPAAGQRWLADALEEALAGRAVKRSRTEALGCIIPGLGREVPSYRRDIAPIITRKCSACHNPVVGALPTDLYKSEGLRARAATIKEVVLTGRMPPIYFDPAYGTPRGALTAKEKQLLVRWFKADAPVEPGTDPATPPPLIPWKIRGFTPDLVWESPVEHVIASTETTVLRYVALGGPAPEDLWISTTVFRHTTPTVVQHAALYALPRPLETYAIDPLGDGAGFDLSPTLGAQAISNQSGGVFPVGQAPTGTAWLLPKGWYPVLELHYASQGRAARNRASVGLGLAKTKGLSPLKTAFLMRTDFTIPPQAKNYVLTAERRFDRPFRVLGFKPHVHMRGQRARLLARRPDGSEEVLFSVPRYPLKVGVVWGPAKSFPAGTVLIAEATYDNSPDNPLNPDPSATVPSGRNLMENEMLKAFVLYEDGARP